MTLSQRIGARIPDSVLARVVSLAYSRFEPETRRLGQMAGRGGTMIDVGGWYGPWARRMAGRADRVVVIEPTWLHRVLRQTLPPSVQVIAAAASDSCGEAEIWLSEAGGGKGGFGSLHKRSVHGSSALVPMVSLDSLGLQRVTFVKIDVEGHELAVLQGAAGLIERDKPRLFIEIEERFQPTRDVIGLLGGWGYQGFVLQGRQWAPLSGFDLAAAQARTSHVADRGLLWRTVWPYPRYVNSALFLPDGQVP
jgi:FkbM family methyltransferase